MYTYNLANAFAATVDKFADKTALIFEDHRSYTFAELSSLANRIAKALQSRGVKTRSVVCIAGDKEVHTYACILACLKLGAPYAVLDYESPVERLKKIIERCGPELIFAKSELITSLKKVIHCKFLENEPAKLNDEISQISSESLKDGINVTSDMPAYIMFTSGSTGFPKGAVMTHGNVLNFIDWGRKEFKVNSTDIFTNVNPLYFDNSVYDFYVSLFNGAALVPLSKSLVSQPLKLVATIDEIGCTAWFSVPSLLIYLMANRVLTADKFKSIERIVFGGEGYPKAKLQQLYNIYSDKVDFYNVYGPTECTCMCSSYVISDKDFDDPTGFPALGSIADNFDFHIVNEDGEVVTDGEAGELCLMGGNVGKGYYNDPERTSLNFVQNPKNNSYAEIMYKTGDLVSRNLETNLLHILGRVDNQIKHMGYRIELEEIENALCRIDSVSQAAVVHGEKRGLSKLLALVKVSESCDVATIRSSLKELLPMYMIPTDFRLIEDDLPKNQNGKIDRKKIAANFFA